jgi:hypothetical protein
VIRAEVWLTGVTVTVYRWVLRFMPLLAEAARPCRHAVGDRWPVDETYVKVAGRWRYVYRAVDQFGQVIDVLVSARRDAKAARRFWAAQPSTHMSQSVVEWADPEPRASSRIGDHDQGELGAPSSRDADLSPGRGRFLRIVYRPSPVCRLGRSGSTTIGA